MVRLRWPERSSERSAGSRQDDDRLSVRFATVARANNLVFSSASYYFLERVIQRRGAKFASVALTRADQPQSDPIAIGGDDRSAGVRLP